MQAEGRHSIDFGRDPDGAVFAGASVPLGERLLVQLLAPAAQGAPQLRSGHRQRLVGRALVECRAGLFGEAARGPADRLADLPQDLRVAKQHAGEGEVLHQHLRDLEAAGHLPLRLAVRHRELGADGALDEVAGLAAGCAAGESLGDGQREPVAAVQAFRGPEARGGGGALVGGGVVEAVAHLRECCRILIFFHTGIQAGATDTGAASWAVG
ncbi:hypothetical protein [Rathayibacter sp. VKM Ac-2760]|uniref:hypothetical protein n=1 Tax=Rathayibacter sp. VKM Ac-2760 TaxID=2609253 RepID=UPI001FCA3C05|nr:hypothetical protein [Rathayibacter sp. VKM Ac-2760]